MLVKTLHVGQLGTNCYLIADRGTKEGAIIDPGGDVDRILDSVDDLCIKYVINTHAHFDHTLGNGGVMQALSDHQETAPELVAHSRAAPLLSAGGGAAVFGFRSVPSPTPDRFVKDGDVLVLGQLTLCILYTPGHSSGSISLYCAASKLLFVGDVLFRQGVGRTDLHGGDWAALMDSIRNRLFILPDETVVYPGHGPSTTIGEEKRMNPWIR